MLKLNEQIAARRKALGWTQEELAGRLGVTGQSVSKWESGICCPDIQLLPTLADLFDTDTDTLLGRRAVPRSPETLRDAAGLVRRYLETLPVEDLFRDSFRLAALLHEILATDCYRKAVPWDAEENFERLTTEEEPRRWGTSITSLPAGATIYSGSGIFFGYNDNWSAPPQADLRHLAASLRRLGNTDTLCVLFALYGLTRQDFDRYVTTAEIAEAAVLSPARTEALLDDLPLTVRRDEEGVYRYRLDGAFMHLPALLGLGIFPEVPGANFR